LIGAGTIINPIIKIVTTVAILGAVYLFFVKPALDTTEEISDRAFDTQESVRENLEDALDTAPGGGSSIDIQIPNSAKQAQKLGDCVSAAGTDIDQINRCMNRFSP
jgi:uncharacterized protein HemX